MVMAGVLVVVAGLAVVVEAMVAGAMAVVVVGATAVVVVVTMVAGAGRLAGRKEGVVVLRVASAVLRAELTVGQVKWEVEWEVAVAGVEREAQREVAVGEAVVREAHHTGSASTQDVDCKCTLRPCTTDCTAPTIAIHMPGRPRCKSCSAPLLQPLSRQRCTPVALAAHGGENKCRLCCNTGWRW